MINNHASNPNKQEQPPQPPQPQQQQQRGREREREREQYHQPHHQHQQHHHLHHQPQQHHHHHHHHHQQQHHHHQPPYHPPQYHHYQPQRHHDHHPGQHQHHYQPPHQSQQFHQRNQYNQHYHNQPYNPHPHPHPQQHHHTQPFNIAQKQLPANQPQQPIQPREPPYQQQPPRDPVTPPNNQRDLQHQSRDKQQREHYYKGHHPSSSINHRLYNSAFSSKAIEDRHDVVFRRVRGILNKITPETFEKLSNELVNVGIDSPRTLRGVIYLLFDKVLKDLKYSSLYAKLCQELSEKAPNFEQDPNGPNTFCKFLISKCEDEFERRRKATEDFDYKSELTDEEFELKAIAKQKMLGNIKFICELGKKRLLQKEILHECIRNLLSKKKEQPIQEQAQDLECLCQIMRTIGSLLDIHASKNLMNQYFERIELFSKKPELPSRIRFMLKDIIDLRNSNWRPRTYQREDNVPQPLSKLREEAGPIIGNSALIDKLGNSDDDGPSFTTTTDFHYGSSSSFLPMNQFESSTGLKKTTSEVRQTHSLQSTPPKNAPINKPSQFQPHQLTAQQQQPPTMNRPDHSAPQHHLGLQPHYQQTHPQQVINRTNSNQMNRNNNQGNRAHNNDKPSHNIVAPIAGTSAAIGLQGSFNPRENRPRYIQKPSESVDFSLRPSHNLVGNRTGLNPNRPRSSVDNQDDRPQAKAITHNPHQQHQPQHQMQQSIRKQGETSSPQRDAMKSKVVNDGVQSSNLLSSAPSKNDPNKVEQMVADADQNKLITENENHNRNAAREFHLNNFKSVLIDCFNNGSANINRTAAKVKELKIPKSYHQDCLINAIKQSITKTENERDNLGKLLVSLIPSTFESQSLLNSFGVIFEQMHALEVETPKIKSLVAGILAKAVYDNLFNLEELGVVLTGGKHHPLFLLFLQKLEQTAGQTWLNEKFIGSKINLMDMLPEADRSKDRLASILKDRNLGFLDPMLTIEPELWSQMKDKDPTPAAMYRWIKDNVEQTIQTTPTFAHILIKCLLKYIHNVAIEKAKCSTSADQEQQVASCKGNDGESLNKSSPSTTVQQNINDLEKEILSKYQQVLHAILNDKKMQLASLYALQSFYHGLDFPKGSLLRWFHMMYDMNIVDDDVFFTWKEEINDEFPGKGQALFQVNTWLNWLAEAESEDEDEEEDQM